MPHTDRSAHGSPDGLVLACRAHGVRDRRVLEAFARTPRELFVPPDWVVESYRDRPIPIPHGQVTTQPSLVAQMVASLQLDGSERVLEIGTGLGYQAAILARLASDVYSIERFADLAESARRNLKAAAVLGVTVVVGDGTLGLPELAPFDAVVVSAASPEVPGPLVAQLAEGGRVVHPVGFGGNEVVTAYYKRGGRLVRDATVTPAHFVRLVGAQGLPDESP